MNQVAIRAVPFLITLTFGVALSAVVGPLLPKSAIRYSSCDTKHTTAIVRGLKNKATRININSVPDADFPEIVNKRGPIYAHVRLVAVFDADGSVKLVRPYPMLPYGVSESAAGSDEFPDVTPFQFNGRFVDFLPYGLAEAAIQQVSRIDYKPKTRNGQPDSQTVFVSTEYSYSESLSAVGCSRIALAIMDDMGVVWQGNTWVSRSKGCWMF